MRSSKYSFRFLVIICAAAFQIFLEGCSNIGFERSVPIGQQSPIFIAPTLYQVASTATPNPLDIQQPNCTNELYYLEDLTIPDGEVVTAGSIIEKKWSVRNSGTCNWNETYTVRLINGPDLGAASPRPLIPSRSGTDAVIEIDFTAPDQPGNYISTWQAFNSTGEPFGDYFSIEINVSSH